MGIQLALEPPFKILKITWACVNNQSGGEYFEENTRYVPRGRPRPPCHLALHRTRLFVLGYSLPVGTLTIGPGLQFIGSLPLLGYLR